MALACSAGPRPSGLPATTTTITGLPVCLQGADQARLVRRELRRGVVPEPLRVRLLADGDDHRVRRRGVRDRGRFVGRERHVRIPALQALEHRGARRDLAGRPLTAHVAAGEGTCQLTLQPPT